MLVLLRVVLLLHLVVLGRGFLVLLVGLADRVVLRLLGGRVGVVAHLPGGVGAHHQIGEHLGAGLLRLALEILPQLLELRLAVLQRLLHQLLELLLRLVRGR